MPNSGSFEMRTTRKYRVVLAVLAVGFVALAVLGFVTESRRQAWTLLVTFGVGAIICVLLWIRGRGTQLVIDESGLRKLTWPRHTVEWQRVTCLELKRRRWIGWPPVVVHTYILVTAASGVGRDGGRGSVDRFAVPTRGLEVSPDDVYAVATARWERRRPARLPMP